MPNSMEQFDFFESKSLKKTKNKREDEQKIDTSVILKKIKTPRFREAIYGDGLFESLIHLVKELKKEMPNYDTILSDDISGREVSLLLRRLIDKKRTELNKPPVKTYFLASGRHITYESKIFDGIKNFIKNEKDHLGKVLLVTEFISSGESISKLVNILEQLEIDFDIAAVSMQNSPKDEGYQNNIGYLNKKIKYGDVGKGGLAFHDRTQSIDKIFIYEKDISAHPYVKQDILKEEQKEIKESREDVEVLAEELSKFI
ncbi:MAG: hypothetical protein PHE59_01515 [Patescibacteria group bacterium]|nr:hypothetical protein [Patescibacteria group bacterium]MDD5164028.1 hypothetical protein [Patescibacteria group bacterium]MDD5534888.1 hypothetical protein [Patescibacteria group bacterium]